MSIDHYENFPVASVLCPPHLRAPIRAIYAFARTADDLADEGTATAEERARDLQAYRADLLAVTAGRASGERWKPVFSALHTAISQYALPVSLLLDLLSAFEQDLTQHQYTDRAALLGYCQRSANPVGRLLLHLYGVNTPAQLAQSDDICSALQLINFWQDLSVDTLRGRLYIPLDDCERQGVDPRDVTARRATPTTQALIQSLASWARELMFRGAPLVRHLPGRAGWELRAVIQGGLRILDKIDALGDKVLVQRPTLSWTDAPTLTWRVLRMPTPPSHSLHKAAS